MSELQRLAGLLIMVDVALIALFLVSGTSGYEIDLFHLNGELNLVAWWGGGKLLISAAAVALVPLFASERGVASLPLYWIVAVGLAYLSADEILMLHERITLWNLRNDVGLPMFRGTNGAWIGVYLLIFVVFASIFLRQILAAARADPGSAAFFAGGFAVLISGSVVAEVMGYFDLLGGMNSPSQLVIEEGLELIGASLILVGSVRHALMALRPQTRLPETVFTRHQSTPPSSSPHSQPQVPSAPDFVHSHSRPAHEHRHVQPK